MLRQGLNWVEIHHHFSYTNVTVVPLGTEWAESTPGIKQAFTVEFPYSQFRCGFGAYTCVETVKSLLGIKAWWVITPKQLYRYINHG